MLGVSYVIRMVADGTQDGHGCAGRARSAGSRTCEAFAGNNLLPLVPLAVTPLVLFAVAVALDRRRDTDEGIIRDTGTAAARTPAAARARSGSRGAQRLGGLLGWGLGLLAFGFVMGAITKAFVDFIADDPDIAELTAQFGFTSLTTPIGFVASMDALCVAVVCVYAVHGDPPPVGGRAVRPPRPGVRRPRVAHGVADGGDRRRPRRWRRSRCSPIGSGTWLGVAVTGVDITFVESIGAVAQSAPLVVLFLGLAVVVHGDVPEVDRARRRRRRRWRSTC